MLAFDFFFVAPKFSLAVADSEYLMTFAGFLVVGLVISTQVARSRERAESLRLREVQTASLYYLSRDLAGAADLVSVTGAVLRNLRESLKAEIVVFLADGEQLEIISASEKLDIDLKERAVADWTFRNHQPAGCGTATLGSADLLYLPLKTATTIHRSARSQTGARSRLQLPATPPSARRLCQPDRHGPGTGALLPAGGAGTNSPGQGESGTGAIELHLPRPAHSARFHHRSAEQPARP